MDWQAKWNSLKPWLLKLTKVGRVGLVILTVLGVGVLSLLYRAYDYWQSERKFRVLVPVPSSRMEYLDFVDSGGVPLADCSQYSQKVSGDVVTAVRAATKYCYSKNQNDGRVRDIDFYAFPEGHDEKTFREAFKIAMEVANEDGREVAGAIGHVTSTVTAEYGEIYGENDLPLIMPLATATELPNLLRGTAGVPAVLRLPPANEKQANLVSRFLLSKKAYSTLVVKDLSNLTYSNDLVDSFRNSFVKAPFKKLAGLKEALFGFKDFGRVYAVVPAGGGDGEPFMRPALDGKKIDALFLVGMTECAVETLTQAWASNLDAKFTILTDGTVDEYLLPRLNGLVLDGRLIRDENDIPLRVQKREVLLTHPVEDRLPGRLEEVLANLDDGERYRLEMTHAQYVIDAALFYLEILNDRVAVKNRWRSPNRLVISALESWRLAGNTPALPYDETWQYTLDKSGSSRNRDYHLYRSRLPLVAEGDSSTVDWSHADELCPSHRR